jgi:hypothetical protein
MFDVARTKLLLVLYCRLQNLRCTYSCCPSNRNSLFVRRNRPDHRFLWTVVFLALQKFLRLLNPAFSILTASVHPLVSRDGRQAQRI